MMDPKTCGIEGLSNRFPGCQEDAQVVRTSLLRGAGISETRALLEIRHLEVRLRGSAHGDQSMFFPRRIG